MFATRLRKDDVENVPTGRQNCRGVEVQGCRDVGLLLSYLIHLI